MSGSRRRLTIASLILTLGLAGAHPAVASDSGLGGLLGLTGLDEVVSEVPVITDDVGGGVGGLLGDDGNLLGGVLGGTGGLLGGLLGGPGAAPGHELSIQPVPTLGGDRVLEDSTIVGGLLDGLLGLGSLSEVLAGRL